jgi:hypothetical protein
MRCLWYSKIDPKTASYLVLDFGFSFDYKLHARLVHQTDLPAFKSILSNIRQKDCTERSIEC